MFLGLIFELICVGHCAITTSTTLIGQTFSAQAVKITKSSYTLEVERCTFSGCTLGSGQGAAIYSTGSINIVSSNFSFCKVSYSISGSVSGGAIFSQSTCTITTSNFLNCSAVNTLGTAATNQPYCYGGAVYIS